LEKGVAAKQRHVPLRRCVACGTQSPQRELIRITRIPSGEVVIDQKGNKTPGRGAYLCLNLVCWDQALKKKRLDRALRETISAENTKVLRQFTLTLDIQE
jgi:predicted RNA-binding protein YlxR (DUF448 family)